MSEYNHYLDEEELLELGRATKTAVNLRTALGRSLQEITAERAERAVAFLNDALRIIEEYGYGAAYGTPPRDHARPRRLDGEEVTKLIRRAIASLELDEPGYGKAKKVVQDVLKKLGYEKPYGYGYGYEKPYDYGKKPGQGYGYKRPARAVKAAFDLHAELARAKDQIRGGAIHQATVALHKALEIVEGCAAALSEVYGEGAFIAPRAIDIDEVARLLRRAASALGGPIPDLNEAGRILEGLYRELGYTESGVKALTGRVLEIEGLEFDLINELQIALIAAEVKDARLCGKALDSALILLERI